MSRMTNLDEKGITVDPLRSQWPPWRQTEEAVVERFKQESMYGLSAKKVAVVEG